MTIRRLSFTDRLLSNTQLAVSVLAGKSTANRPCPEPVTARITAEAEPDRATSVERGESAALMRVNHVGEICAQALYQGQALTARKASIRGHFEKAAAEEQDHLAWTSQRLTELGARQSLLNPVWYVGSFVIGALAGARSDAESLGFMAETEHQVERHLAGHLDALPATDFRSRAIVAQMKRDESAHAASALEMGGKRPSWAIRQGMTAVARIMTTVSARI